jgi:simple sugar transport system permease protein
MVWLSLLLLPVSYVALFKTPIGLRIRSVGEHPKAADTVGIPVYRTRYAAVTLSGALAALGGVFLSIGFVNSFTENMTAGRGFIALAALIFGGWRPFGAFAAALLFGFSSALAARLPDLSASDTAAWPLLFQTLPYVLTLIAVAGVIGRSIPPAAIGRPYVKQVTPGVENDRRTVLRPSSGCSRWLRFRRRSTRTRLKNVDLPQAVGGEAIAGRCLD